MSCYFNLQQELRFPSIEGVFTIEEIIGRGASSVVYRATHVNARGNRTEHLLKEYYPRGISLNRNEDLELTVSSPEKNQIDFDRGLERFREGYRRQMDLRMDNDLKNVSSNVQGIYCGYGTEFIDMTCFNGDAYSRLEEDSLTSLLHRVKAVTQVLLNYHRRGLLHLDIKPDNIFALPETSDLVMLFDFDSVTEKSMVQENTMLSYTKSWAAPEQKLSYLRKNICEATDLFAVGEILFFKLFRRHSEEWERRSFSTYLFDSEASLLKGVNQRLLSKLTEFFQKTLCADVRKRWQSAEKLLAALDEMIEIAGQKIFLCSSCPPPKEFFVGREQELEELHSQLADSQVLFVCGMGGIGKSELVKNYAKQYAGSYDVILWSAYSGSWISTITSDSDIPLASFGRGSDESVESYFDRKIRKLQELCSRKVLLIIDNLDQDEFSEAEEGRWEKILGVGCTLLITSRISGWEYPTQNVETLRSFDDLMRIFRKWSNLQSYSQAEEQTAAQIIDLLGKHTLAVEMVAKQIRASGNSLEWMLSTLQHGGIAKSGREKISLSKDARKRRASAFDHLCVLFDIAQLTDTQLTVLCCMTLAPLDGIDRSVFRALCKLESLDDVNLLCEYGWLSFTNDKLRMHPLIAEVIAEKAPEYSLRISTYCSSLAKVLLVRSRTQSVTKRRYYCSVGISAAQKTEKYHVITEEA